MPSKNIAGKWHIITLQEASDYVDHGLLAIRFHVTHYASCAILFNKDIFHPNIDVKSIRKALPRNSFLLFVPCVGHAIVQGDEGPVSGVAQGVEVHGVPVRHGEKQEKGGR